MCGRFLLHAPLQSLEVQFAARATVAFSARYNLAPSQPVLVVKATEAGRVLTLQHWGLIPAWAKDAALGPKLINARAETAADKPSFRGPFRRSRCIIPASGFYEWQVRAGGGKQPHLIQAADGAALALAGLWDRWQGPDGPVESCTILTTPANAFMAPVHDRMPVLLAPADYGLWLDPGIQDPARLQSLLRPAGDGLLRMHPVSPRVGSVRNDDPGLMEPFLG